jgi:hypothetical protein
VELPAPARLRLPVDGHTFLDQQGLRLGTRPGDTGQLQQLAEPDRVAANLDLVQTPILAASPREAT